MALGRKQDGKLLPGTSHRPQAWWTWIWPLGTEHKEDVFSCYWLSSFQHWPGPESLELPFNLCDIPIISIDPFHTLFHVMEVVIVGNWRKMAAGSYTDKNESSCRTFSASLQYLPDFPMKDIIRSVDQFSITPGTKLDKGYKLILFLRISSDYEGQRRLAYVILLTDLCHSTLFVHFNG